MSELRAAKVRFKVVPRGVPPEKAARRLGVTFDRFQEKLPELLGRGFPPADPTTGNYDLKKIDAWMDDPQPKLTVASPPRDAQSVMGERIRRLRGDG